MLHTAIMHLFFTMALLLFYMAFLNICSKFKNPKMGPEAHFRVFGEATMGLGALWRIREVQ